MVLHLRMLAERDLDSIDFFWPQVWFEFVLFGEFEEISLMFVFCSVWGWGGGRGLLLAIYIYVYISFKINSRRYNSSKV